MIVLNLFKLTQIVVVVMHVQEADPTNLEVLYVLGVSLN